MNLRIRQESTDDFNAVFEVNALAFGQENEAALVNALRNNANVYIPDLSLVATIDDKVVGHILFTKIKIIGDGQNEYGSLALAPMAVMPGFQQQGIGGQLIKAGLAKARELHFTSVIVLGHTHYYPKFGFRPAGTWNIKPPFDVPGEAFMGIELVENALSRVSGTVMYPPEFDIV